VKYRSLLACYLSGQIEEWAWQEHLSDLKFKAWLDSLLPAGA